MEGERKARPRPTAVVILAAVFMIAFLVTAVFQNKPASGYTYETMVYWGLGNYDQTDFMDSAARVIYGDWECTGQLCGVPFASLAQYANVWYTQYEFTCWYHRVYEVGPFLNQQSGYRTTNYWTTPYWKTTTGWGFGYSYSGDQLTLVSYGTDTSECYVGGAVYGVHWQPAIQRYSSYAYIDSYGWWP